MGLSSSQARLLSLTSRMHDIEYKAQNLEAQKLQMANESAHVYKEYENALNATTIQLKQIGSDGSASYIDATYMNMLKNGYYIQFSTDNTLYGENGPLRDGLIGITQTDKNNYDKANGNIDLFVAYEKGIAGTTLSTENNTKGFKEIYTAEQLKQVTGSGKYILMADIDMSTQNWSPQSFSGTLDGNGHSIIGLKNSLFSTINAANISNLGIEVNITSSTNGKIGALARESNGNTQIENVSVSGSINTGSDSVGGLIALAQSTSITNVSSSVNINNSAYRSGGIVAGAIGGNVVISNSGYQGSITSTNSSKNNNGGIVGESWSCNLTIDNCTAQGNIKSTCNNPGNTSAGGILGYYNNSTIVNIKNTSYTGSTIENGTTGNNIIGSRSSAITISGQPSGNIGASLNTTDITDGGNNPTYREMFQKISDGKYYIDDGNNPAAGYEDDSNWFTNMLNAGFLYIFKKDSSTGELYQTNVATDTSLQEVSNKTALKKAEAKYEADMRKIDAKDKKFDTDLAALETERNAIKTEMDTLKSVAKDNVDRTFKLFS